jgi:hypothetical protein
MNKKQLTRDEFINLTPGSIITNELTNVSYKTVYVKMSARKEMEVIWADAINTSTDERVKITYHSHWIRGERVQPEKVAA